MVNFDALRQKKNKPAPIRPQDIFRSLPKPDGINDLYESQGKVLTEWFENREKKDTVIKLHTGGGKTLVGLLIAQSSINEKGYPALYICPTNQLVHQTIEKARELHINAVPYKKGEGFDEDFINGKAIMVCTYHALFNGKSRFKLRGSATPSLKVSAIIADDAHVAFDYIRDIFTIEICSDKNQKLYDSMVGIFRESFKYSNKLGTFDDTISGKSDSILEIPYWEWFKKIDVVQNLFSESSDSNFVLSWPIFRDNLKFCHAIVSNKMFSITPYFPLVDLFPTFSDSPRRIYMSATITDDSEIIRTFDADEELINKPLSSPSLAGISERMILAPDLMKFDDNIREIVKRICRWTANDKKLGVIVLAPSKFASSLWEEKGFSIASDSSEVEEYITKLQKKQTTGPIIFINRYDGIDLPGDSCRLLVMDNLPIGTSVYELFLTCSLNEGERIDRLLAQRIEQGLGRGARGSGDHCVVILLGGKLSGWIGRTNNLKMLTGPTSAQIHIGTNISTEIYNTEELMETIDKSYMRKADWTAYHAAELSDSISQDMDAAISNLKVASLERKAFNLWRDGHHEKAIKKLDSIMEDKVDAKMYGWVRQFAARIACDWGKRELYMEYQKDAFSKNKNLLKPVSDTMYGTLPQPSKQSVAIIKKIKDYSLRRSFISQFDSYMEYLNPKSSTNQFEESLKQLGTFLGFVAERFDNNGDGPDVLWLLPNNIAFAIEAKSRKSGKNIFNKTEHGQLLVAGRWVAHHYPSYQCYMISVYPTNRATQNAYAQETYALTYDMLNLLISDTREMFLKLCDRFLNDAELEASCISELENSNLKFNKILDTYMKKFIVD